MVRAVVPIEGRSGKAGAIKFFGDFIVFPEGLEKMIQMGIANILNSKVFNNECKHDGASLVMPEIRDGGCLIVVEFGKVVSEEVVR